MKTIFQIVALIATACFHNADAALRGTAARNLLNPRIDGGRALMGPELVTSCLREHEIKEEIKNLKAKAATLKHNIDFTQTFAHGQTRFYKNQKYAANHHIYANAHPGQWANTYKYKGITCAPYGISMNVDPEHDNFAQAQYRSSLEQYRLSVESHSISTAEACFATCNENHHCGYATFSGTKWGNFCTQYDANFNCYPVPTPRRFKNNLFVKDDTAMMTWLHDHFKMNRDDVQHLSRSAAKITHLTTQLNQMKEQYSRDRHTLAHLKGMANGEECHMFLELLHSVESAVSSVGHALTKLEKTLDKYTSMCGILDLGIDIAAIGIDTMIQAAVGEEIEALHASPVCKTYNEGAFSKVGTGSEKLAAAIEVVNKVLDTALPAALSHFGISISANALHFGEEIVEDIAIVVLDFACADFAEGLWKAFEPVLMCKLNLDGKNCGSTLGFTCSSH